MMIVCTKDRTIAEWTRNPVSESAAWDPQFCLDPGFDQARATVELTIKISGLKIDEPLCLSAHGNDEEFGDEGSGPTDWGWNARTIAEILAQNAPQNYEGPILIRTCAETITSFAPRLALELESMQALDGVWIFGYNRPIPITQTYPNPNRLAQKIDLQGSLVD